jgi:H+-transporting ATPase
MGPSIAILKLYQKSAPVDHQNGDKALVQAIKTFRDQGLGSLGLAQRHERGNWEFLGVLLFLEPPRQDTRPAFKLAAKLGARVKVISGWYEALVERSARVAGIDGPPLRTDVIDNLLDQINKLSTHINEADVYTKLNDKHRELISAIPQHSGHRVAITGSGTSHIPTFRKADFGIAIAAATDESISHR